MSTPCPKCQKPLTGPDQPCAACGYKPEPANPLSAQAQAGAMVDDHPEAELWAGRISFKDSLGRWTIYVLAVIAAVVLVVMVDKGRHKFVSYALWIAAVLVGLYLLGGMLYRRWSLRYRLTDQRLFIERGLIGRNIDQTELVRVDDVRVHQGVIDRILGLGDVVVVSADRTDPETVLAGIENPMAVAEHIRTQVRRFRNKRSLYVESL